MTNLSYGDYFTGKSTASGLIYRGWFIKNYADDHKLHPGATLFVEESKDADGNEWFRPVSLTLVDKTRLIEGDENYRPLPPAARTVATYANAYQDQREATLNAIGEANALRTTLHEDSVKIQTLSKDLDDMIKDRDQDKKAILRMFEIANQMGYGGEATQIMNKAGVSLPPMTDFEVQIHVTGTLSFTRKAYTQEAADAMVHQEDVQYMLEDTPMAINSWEVKDADKYGD